MVIWLHLKLDAGAASSLSAALPAQGWGGLQTSLRRAVGSRLLKLVSSASLAVAAASAAAGGIAASSVALAARDVRPLGLRGLFVRDRSTLLDMSRFVDEQSRQLQALVQPQATIVRLMRPERLWLSDA